MAFKRSKITREIIKNLIQKVASKNWNYCKFEQKINYIWDGFLSCAIQYLALNVKLVLHCDNQLDLFEYENVSYWATMEKETKWQTLQWAMVNSMKHAHNFNSFNILPEVSVPKRVDGTSTLNKYSLCGLWNER